MMANEFMASLRSVIAGYLRQNPEIGGMVVHPGSATFAGVRTEPASASVVVEGPRVSTKPDLAGLGDHLVHALSTSMAFAPGPQAAVLLADRGPAGLRFLLVRSWVDVSDAYPDRRSPRHAARLASDPAASGREIVVGGVARRARIGNVVGSVHEVRPDGSLMFEERLDAGLPPGPGVLVGSPSSVSPRIEALAIPQWVAIAPPTDADLAAWSDFHYGSLDVGKNLAHAIWGA